MSTPHMGSPDATRTVKLKYCQCKMITGTITSQIPLVLGKQKPDDYPLSTDQCLQLIGAIESQLPDIIPNCCCTDQEITLLESQIYLLNRWRVFMEEKIADRPVGPVDGILGVISKGVIESRSELEYKIMSELQQRLASPISSR
ncbi:hypothetical protein [Spirosoma litoris]